LSKNKKSTEEKSSVDFFVMIYFLRKLANATAIRPQSITPAQISTASAPPEIIAIVFTSLDPTQECADNNEHGVEAENAACYCRSLLYSGSVMHVECS